MAYVNTSSSFRSLDFLHGGDGYVGVKAICLSGIAADTPVYILPNESGYMATALAASTYGYVGVPKGADAIASGAVAEFQIGGYRAGVQASAAALTGSVGIPVQWVSTSLHATATATALGLTGNKSTQVAVLTEEVSASTTANMFFMGVYATSV